MGRHADALQRSLDWFRVGFAASYPQSRKGSGRLARWIGALYLGAVRVRRGGLRLGVSVKAERRVDG